MATEVPEGVKLLTISTAVRWFGWGLGEAFLPVFFLLFMKSFFGVGLLASVYNVVFFFAIPVVSYLADNVSAKRLIMAGLIVYVFIGLGYWLAGLTSAVIFLFLARGLNGISYSLDQVGRETYIIRHTPKVKESRVFGYFDFHANMFWIIAVIIGIFLIKMNVPVHWLLFFIVPTSVISFFIVMRVPGKKPPKKKRYSSALNVYKRFFREIKNFSPGLKLLALMYLSFGVISSVIYFFAPTISYSQGGSMIKSVIIILAFALPTMLGQFLGKIADNRKEQTYFAGILFLALALLSLMMIKNYYAVLITVFLASSVFELFYLTNKGIIARISERTHLGEVDGSLNAIGSLGAVLGPITFGFLVDRLTAPVAYTIIIGFTVLISVLVFKDRKYLRKEE